MTVYRLIAMQVKRLPKTKNVLVISNPALYLTETLSRNINVLVHKVKRVILPSRIIIRSLAGRPFFLLFSASEDAITRPPRRFVNNKLN